MMKGKRIRGIRAQEEMLGFALIIIVVAVILLVFLRLSLNKPIKELVESYEVGNFLLASLQHTTDCEDVYGYRTIQELIEDCNNIEKCEDGREVCEVLENTLKEIMENSWKTGEKEPVKAYELKILSNEEEVLLIEQGEKKGNHKGAGVYLSDIDITLTVYY